MKQVNPLSSPNCIATMMMRMMIATCLMASQRQVVQCFTPSTSVLLLNRYSSQQSTSHSFHSSSSTTAHYNSRQHVSSLHAVSAPQQEYTITVLPGDGIGPEITTATNQVLDAICQKFGITMNRVEMSIGGDAIDKYNDPFPTATYEQCVQSDSILLACIGGYKWDSNPRELRPESGLLRLRQQLGLYANLRPAKVLKQLIDASTLKPSIIENVDIMVVRELTGDVYFGTPKGIDTIDGTFLFYYSWRTAGLRSLFSFLFRCLFTDTFRENNSYTPFSLYFSHYIHTTPQANAWDTTI